MKRTKQAHSRILALLLAALLTAGMLAGCGGDNGGGSAEQGETGRFLENEIELPEGFELQTIAKLDDGSLGAGGILYDQEADKVRYCLLRSSDLGQTWETVWENAFVYIAESTIAPDGSAALIEEDWGEETVTSTLYQVSPDGEVSEQEITLPNASDGEANTVWQMECDQSGNLFVVDNSNFELWKLDPETGKCSSAYQEDSVMNPYFGIAGEILCAVHTDGVMLIDAESGEVLESDGALDDVVKNTEYNYMVMTSKGIRIPMAFGAGEDDSILFVNHEGIYTHQRGGSVNEQLVDASLASISDSNMGFLNIVQLDAENIFIAIYDSNSDKRLLHYGYDATISAVPEKEITVYTLTESSLLWQTVTAFQKENPDVYVKLEIGMTGDDGVTAEDAVKQLNTNILAGKGPDVLILDGLPMESYVEKGILEDISDLIDEIEQEDGLFTNIRDAYQQDGAQYVMPVRFLFPVILGNAETVAAGGNLETIADRAEQLAEQGNNVDVIPAYNKRKFLVNLFEVDSAWWTEENGGIDSEKLKDFLKQAKRMYDLDDYSEYDERIAAAGATGLEEDGTKAGSAKPEEVLSYGEYYGQMAVGTLSGLRYFQLIYSAQKQLDFEFALADTDQGLAFVPYLMTSIVSGGDTETAIQFVRTLLGSEVRDDWDNGFPTNRAAYEASCESVAEGEPGFSLGYYEKDGNMGTIKSSAMTQEQVDAMTAILESLTQSSMTDRVIRDLVVEQGVAYLDGTQDLDTTVEEILKKVNLYLAE